LKKPLDQERVQEIITEAVDIEKSFICDSLPVSIHCRLLQALVTEALCKRGHYRSLRLISYVLVMQVALIGMNGELMGQYIEFVADRLLHVLGSEKIYKTKCPFEWMEQLSLQ